MLAQGYIDLVRSRVFRYFSWFLSLAYQLNETAIAAVKLEKHPRCDGKRGAFLPRPEPHALTYNIISFHGLPELSLDFAVEQE